MLVVYSVLTMMAALSLVLLQTSALAAGLLEPLSTWIQPRQITASLTQRHRCCVTKAQVQRQSWV